MPAPQCSADFFHLPDPEPTDACVSLALPPATSSAWAQLLQEAPTPGPHMPQLAAPLRAALHPAREPADPSMAYAAEQARVAPHQVWLAQVRANCCLPEHSFQQRFKHAAGIAS